MRACELGEHVRVHPGAKQGYVHVAIAINCNASSSMSHGPQGSTPWLGPAAFASPSLPLPTHTQPNTTTFPPEGNTEKLSWLRQTCSQHQGEAGQPRAGVGAPEARGVAGGTAFCIARNMDALRVSVSPPLWSPGTSRRRNRRSPQGTSPQPPLPPGRTGSWHLPC